MSLLFIDYILFFVFLHSVSSASLPQAAVHLLHFRNSLPQPSQLLLPWNQSISHCKWPGVSCHSEEDFRVESLNLTRYSLSGSLEKSVSSLCKLPDLLILDLSGNNFTGKIPTLLGNCSKLHTILLGENGFYGSIPAQLFTSSKIVQIDLGYNLLIGIIPTEVGQCQSLEHLGLNNNFLKGEIPVELFTLPNLKVLYLSTNNLTTSLPNFSSLCSLSDLRIHENSLSGPLPVSLSNCRNLSVFYASSNNLGGTIPPNTFKGLLELEFLYLDRNKFDGEIPKSLWGLRNMNELILSDNIFNGSISEEISHFNQLTYLDLSGNNLTGQIPRSFGSLKDLNILYLYDNMITGFLPPEIGNCSSLMEIRVEHNFIRGNLPSEICELQGLKVFHVFNNQIEGHLPQCMERMSNLEELGLYDNRLTGNIPSGFSNLTNLTFLSLAHNDLMGAIPPDLGKNNHPGLVKLDLTGNRLHGVIPSGLCAGNRLVVIALGNNNFNSSFPKEITKCKSLNRFILSNNLLQGNVPDDIEKNSLISYLDISGNLLEGRIPIRFGFWSNLSMIDLSKNNLSGRLPPGLLSSFTMNTIRLQENRFNSVIPDSFSSGQSLQELQLGNNMLEGPIPCNLSKVRHFSSVLNLSMNKLSGEIPKCLGNLDKLEILDISSNTFSGEIPSEVNKMVSLAFVNISFNLLSGKIPDSWAKIVDSHPQSSLGNQRLCSISTESTDCGKGDRKSHTRAKILAGIITAVLLLLAFLLAEDLTFEDILHATERWSDKYVIGRGKHGIVYRTQSVRSRKNWAVKKVDLSETKGSIEMRTLNLTRHRNVMRMEGYSIRNGYGYIVTDYMQGGTLHEIIHQEKRRMALNWETRFRIALGIAQGLSYLHHDCVPKIIHRDIKSNNILMDSELEPRIGDFGTAKMDSDIDESSTVSEIVGTLGYIAPENAYSTKLTEKCDVYGYGVVLLELLCRKLPVDPSFEEGLDIASWVRKNLQSSYNHFQSCVDEEIQSWDSDKQRKALDLMDIAIKCTEFIPENRPSMREVVGSLVRLNCRSKSSVHNT